MKKINFLYFFFFLINAYSIKNIVYLDVQFIIDNSNLRKIL